jgi:DNA invertase Pin-like site-specific DNA recombinase
MSRIFAMYLRVSTDHQTVESQLHALKEYCFRNKIENYEMFIDEGISGAVESRPALNRLMQMVEQDKIQTILTFSFSRIARSTSHLLKTLQKCKDHGASLTSITEQIDTNSPMGMALFTILGALSQLERELIRERVRAGLAAARQKGKLIGRKKLRDSDLIRKLLKNGLSYRAIAAIAKTSHGSVHAEKVSMKREEEALRKKLEEEEKVQNAAMAEALATPAPLAAPAMSPAVAPA